MACFSGNDYVVEYKRELDNLVAYALSRKQELGEMGLRSVIMVMPSWLEAIQELVRISPHFTDLQYKLYEGKL